MWTGLTGPPIIGGVSYPGQAVATGQLVPEHVVEELRGAVEAVYEDLMRAEGELVWQAETALEHQRLVRATAVEFDLALRTERAGDEPWGDARLVRVRRTSPIELTTPNRRRSQSTGRPLYSARLEWRAVRPEPSTVWLANAELDAYQARALTLDFSQPERGALLT